MKELQDTIITAFINIIILWKFIFNEYIKTVKYQNKQIKLCCLQIPFSFFIYDYFHENNLKVFSICYPLNILHEQTVRNNMEGKCGTYLSRNIY